MSEGTATTQVVRFLATGVLGAGLDLALLTAFVEVGGLNLVAATTLALSIACGTHFVLNMRWVFDARGRWGTRAGRYGALVALNYVLTTTTVVGLASLGLSYVAAKVVSLAACAVVNFVAYRHWVFS